MNRANFHLLQHYISEGLCSVNRFMLLQMKLIGFYITVAYCRYVHLI